MKKVLAISSVLLGVVFLAGCSQQPVSLTQPTTPAPAAQTPTPPVVTQPEPISPANTSKIYSSQKYGFEFQYPYDLMITSASTENKVIISGEDSGHWIYSVKIENNSDKLTLEKILAKEVTSIKKIVSDIIIDGVPAKRYSISNYGDYGNASVIIIVRNNILTISGDDSSSSNKTNFEALFSTFKFTK